VGKDVPFGLLQAIADLPEADLRRGLMHLQAAEFLRETSLFPDLQYTFKHALTHQVAYASLLHERRRALHGRIVGALEGLYPDRASERAEWFAHHALRGELWERALPYCRRAGERAFAHSARREAVAWFEQALEALAHLPENQDSIKQAIDLRLDLRYSLAPLGAYDRIFTYLREAEALARSAGDEDRLGLVCAFLANYFQVMGQLDRAVEYGKLAVEIASRLPDPALRSVASGYLGEAYYMLGDYPRAIDLLTKNVVSTEGDSIRVRLRLALHPSVYCRTVLVWCLAETGEFAEGARLAEEGVRLAEAADHPYSRIFASLGLGRLYLRQGRFDNAIPALERSLMLSRAADVPMLTSMVAAPLGSAYAMAGRTVEALTLLDRAMAQVGSVGLTFGRWMMANRLCEALLVASRHADALTLARSVITLGHDFKARGSAAWAHRVLAEAAVQQDPPNAKEAEEAYRLALTEADQLGMRPLAALCHLGLGILYARFGPREQGRAELLVAVRSLQSMGMTFWLARATACLRTLEP
jgi:tetratricopeptide (TPR) repeat protein